MRAISSIPTFVDLNRDYYYSMTEMALAMIIEITSYLVKIPWKRTVE